jgi:hypothetical protein
LPLCSDAGGGFGLTCLTARSNAALGLDEARIGHLTLCMEAVG